MTTPTEEQDTPPAAGRLRARVEKRDIDKRTLKFFDRKYHPKGLALLLRRLKYVLEYVFVGFVWLVVRALGVDRASAISGWLWERFAPRSKRHARAMDNLARAFPEKSLAERDSIARAMWNNLGRVMAEAFFVDSIVSDASRIEIISPEVIEAVRQAGGRVIVASMHYGNWELGMWPLTAAGLLSVGLYQKIHNPHVDALVRRVRGAVWPGGLYSKGPATVRRLLGHVRKGHPVGLLADLRDKHGIEVPFFGHPAPTTVFPALVARHEGALLVAGRVIRTGGVHFRIEGEIVPVPETDNKNADIAHATAALQQVFERWICERPEHWMWPHRRWG